MPHKGESSCSESDDSLESRSRKAILVAETLKARYKVSIPHPDLIPAFPNLFIGVALKTAVKVIVKVSESQRECMFLKKLASPEFKADKRNRTIKPLEITCLNQISAYLIVCPQFQPLENAARMVVVLRKVIWDELASQLKDYCSFLHEHRICHRDIKPSKLGH
ncbi:hypothetical protein BDR26DRAFT_86871 [Obelidium mucronatum]|nr:hypothetical protein BDR26DRAFT_86871 [Obelidium mucronatum]